MGAREVIVRIRSWQNQEDSRDEYYAVSLATAQRAQALAEQNPSGARTLIEIEGQKLEPQVTVEVVEY